MTNEEVIKMCRHRDMVRDHVSKVRFILSGYGALFCNADPWDYAEEKYESREAFREEMEALESLGIKDEVMQKVRENAPGYDRMMADL